MTESSQVSSQVSAQVSAQTSAPVSSAVRPGGDQDARLRERAARVVPGGMYGHLNAAIFAPGYPQFFVKGAGCRQWDADGREYIDFMCSWGPIVLGHRHPRVEEAAARQLAQGDCLNGPGPVLVELAELLVDTIPSADWVMFSKNGTDATTQALMVARAATGRTKVLMAHGAYHGADPWCTPSPAGTTPNERADLIEFTYNDLASVEAAAAQAEGDVAAIICTPFKHDSFEDQELVRPDFARGVRALADRIGAALVIDDVRAGFRLDLRGSWEPYGVRPDLTAWSKAMANGYAIAAVTGIDALRGPAQSLYSTGSFWFSAVAMAAAKATIETLRDEDGISVMERAGTMLREGLASQAKAHGFTINQTGPVAIPWLSFADDATLTKAIYWSEACLRHGVYVHPWHNWFLSAAHSEADVAAALQATDHAFAETRAHFGGE